MSWTKEQKKAYGQQKSADSKARWYENLAIGIEDNNMPWRKPWKGGMTMPRNLKSKKAYRGGNIFSLWMRGMAEGWSDMRFGTRKQLAEAGMSIKGLKNGSGSVIKFAKTSKWGTKTNKKTGEEEDNWGFVVRWYEVWCVEQCEDYEKPEQKDMKAVPEHEMMEFFQSYVSSQQALTLERKGSRAFYRFKDDLIRLPTHEDFETPLGEVMTAFHEAAHSTGHPNRVERALANGFGTPAYAFEELIAELASLITVLSLGGEFNPHVVTEENANSQAYLKHWLKSCEEQDGALDKAFTYAQQASDFMIQYMSKEEEVIG